MKPQDSGLRTIRVPKNIIDELYKDDVVDASFERRRFDKQLKFDIQNEYLVLLSEESESQSALGRVVGETIELIRPQGNVSGLRPRNKEQVAALDSLLDNRIGVSILTGRAGTGKTLLALAAAIELLSEQNSLFDRLILTRPMSWVGKHGLGYLPGTVDEKFAPYLENYMCNLEHLFNKHGKDLTDVVDQLRMEFIPLQLIRGASWSNAIIIADEVQILDFMEMVALGTRVGEGSKLVVMGDLGQRDEPIARENTGLFKLINSKMIQESELVAHIDLVKCERGPIAALFADVFQV